MKAKDRLKAFVISSAFLFMLSGCKSQNMAVSVDEKSSVMTGTESSVGTAASETNAESFSPTETTAASVEESHVSYSSRRPTAPDYTKAVSYPSSAATTTTKIQKTYDSATGLYWESKCITVYKPRSGGIWYPRMFELKNGTLICGFDTTEGTSNTVIKVVTSTDGGYTWTSTGIVASKYPQYDCANVAFYQLDNGELWAAYRANKNVDGQYYSSIRISKSTDNGKTWSNHSLVTEERGNGGVYEPIFTKIGGSIAIFYADDSLSAVPSLAYQNIEYRIWNNESWSEKYIASNGRLTKSRDGMPAVVKLSNGSYLLGIESTGMRSTNPFVIQLKSSPDGNNWSSSFKTVYIPDQSGKKAAAPYLIQLPNGRVALSFQTDEDMSRSGDGYSEMKIMVSTDASCKKFGAAFKPFTTPEGYSSVWNGMTLYKNQLIAVSSTNYPFNQIVMRKASVN